MTEFEHDATLEALEELEDIDFVDLEREEIEGYVSLFDNENGNYIGKEDKKNTFCFLCSTSLYSHQYLS